MALGGHLGRCVFINQDQNPLWTPRTYFGQDSHLIGPRSLSLWILRAGFVWSPSDRISVTEFKTLSDQACMVDIPLKIFGHKIDFP